MLIFAIRAIRQIYKQTLTRLSRGDCSPADIECLMMNALSTVDMWAFFEGFRACRVFTSGDIFDMYFELLDEENRYEADDDE